VLRRVLTVTFTTLLLSSTPSTADAVLIPAGSVGSVLAAERPPYRATITRIPADVRSWMTGLSWRQGCPVPIRNLRLITLRYWGFDRQAHRGRLVVHRDVAIQVAQAFGRLYAIPFPIRRMRLVDAYGADDRTSMEHDNTSAFNCRWRAGQPGVWSEHAYGRAIDVNPLENPYVWSGGYSPPNAGAYLDRSDRRRGMIYHGDRVWRAFRAIGWPWGGDWDGGVADYQHFSSNGR
jgi:hypothetical protein